MRISELNKILNGSIKNIIDVNFKEVKTDSRDIGEGDIFLCINAGYLYIKDAIKRGAVCIITSQDIDDDITIIKVNDTKASLITLAAYYRDQYSKPLIAITGSVGKTTTKELISKSLSTNRKVLMSMGNKNNIIGISDTLLKLNDSYDCVVLEVGMNHAGEIHEISNIIKPTISVITCIGSSHIGNLHSKKNILKAKMEIMDGNPYSLLVLNGEDEYLKRVNGIHCYKDSFPFSSPFNHTHMNYILAIKICLLLGMSYNTTINILTSIPQYKERMNVIKLNGKTIIDDSYNASYESVKGGLEYVSGLSGQKMVILGDILELGSKSERIHKSLIKPLKEINNCTYLFVGEYFKVIPFGDHFETTEELLSFIADYLFDNIDIIYVKASHAWGFNRIVDFIFSL